MAYYHSILNIGFRLGNLSRDVEIVIERLNNKDSNSKKFQLELYRVQENLKYILDELDNLPEFESVKIDIQEYYSQLIGIKDKDDNSETRQTLLKKIKKGVIDRKYRPDRELSSIEIYELDLKLKGWKDRILGEFVKLN